MTQEETMNKQGRMIDLILHIRICVCVCLWLMWLGKATVPQLRKKCLNEHFLTSYSPILDKKKAERNPFIFTDLFVLQNKMNKKITCHL